MDFKGKFSSIVWKSSNVERETSQVVQTGERAWQTVFDNTFSRSSDVQEVEVVFFEINKFKSLGYSLATKSHSGLVRCNLWKTRRNKLTQFWKALDRKEPTRSDNILCKWREKNVWPLPTCIRGSSIKGRSRLLKIISKPNVFIRNALLTTAQSFSIGRSLANSGTIPNEVKLITPFLIKQNCFKRSQLLLTYGLLLLLSFFRRGNPV